MKLKAPLALTLTALTALTLTACGAGEAADNTRQVEETLYPHVRAELQSAGSTIELDDALHICNRLREGATAGELVDEVNPHDPVAYRAAISAVATGMCQFG